MSQRVCPKCEARFSGDIRACPIDGTTLAAPSDPFIGTTIAGRYLVEQLLGVGGMGAVYRARHQFIGRDVALKFLDPSLTRNERLRKRFLGEARAANQINHEHIIDITDFGETEDGLVYMVMEYLEGHALSEEIERGPIALRRALRIALQTALGLGRAHELGVVHRDIKPANIYLTRRRMDRDFVKILDFGVARIEKDARITGQNMIVGTPEYISPEQIRSVAARPASDLYSLGCVLFEMLTGRLPFEGKTTVLLVRHINDPAPAPSTYEPTIPPAVDRLILRLLSKKPEDRHRDAYHLVQDLQRLLDGLPGQTDQSQKPRTTRESPMAPEVLASAQPEEEHWAKTALLYRQLAHEVHPAGTTPEWLLNAVRRVEELVAEVRVQRQQLEKAAATATLKEEEERKPRQQIGHALDELAQDDSRLGGQILELVAALEPAESQLDAAMHVVLSCATSLPSALKLGMVVEANEDQLLQELLRASAELSQVRETVAALRSRLTRKKLERRDLRYQIAQLKEKLSAFNKTSTMDMEIWHEEVHKLTSQIQEKLEAIGAIGKTIAQHFASYPEVADRLSEEHPAVLLASVERH
jgi:serine/threonine-protein kinase